MAWLGKGRGRNCSSLGLDEGLWTRGGGGAAEESRCSPALTLLTASVTGPVSYYSQPVFGMCVLVHVCVYVCAEKSELHG